MVYRITIFETIKFLKLISYMETPFNVTGKC